MMLVKLSNVTWHEVKFRQAQWLKPIIPACKRPRQDDCKFKASLDFRMRLPQKRLMSGEGQRTAVTVPCHTLHSNVYPGPTSVMGQE